MITKIGQKEIGVYEVVSRFELDTIEVNVERTPSFQFVIDILRKSNGQFFPKVYRRESFSIRPSSYSAIKKSEEFDENILVEDHMREWEIMVGSSCDDVLKQVLSEIGDIFQE